MTRPRGRNKPASDPRPRVSKGTGGTRPQPGVAPPTARHSLVVGIGASAGGLGALKSFFGSMPPKPGIVFVVVVHLDPTHESLMPELLAKSTTLTVEQVRDKQPLEPDHVYVIPPNRMLSLDQGELHLHEVADRRGLRGAIDHFFRSLAADQGANAVAIVLSGTGTEGTLGARAVKAEGGLVIAQIPDTASQPGMPSNLIATGLPDLTLAPDRMPRALLDYARDTGRRRASLPAVSGPHWSNELQTVLAVLRTRTKRDFRGYRQGTLQRRIERRMALQQIHSTPKYIEFLRSHPTEADRLAKDLLIGVTSFFRDPPVFEELAAKVVDGLVKDREPETPIRVWVPGCATGEEAYSIAIALAERITASQSACRMQIFATDLDERAIETARGGTYPETIALDVSPERLQRFFTREDHRYTVVKSVRDTVTFAVQNLISDPPFSRLDLVSCRNVLIYLEPDVQQKLLATFHFALKPGGYLMLGNAEGIGALDDLFVPLSKRRRIFRRLGAVRHPPLAFSTPHAVTGEGAAAITGVPEPTAATLASECLLQHFAPSAVVVKGSGQIVRLYGAMDRYIHLPTGDATLDVLSLARDPLKPPLRAALHDAVRRNQDKVIEVLDRRSDTGRIKLRITVRPLAGRVTTDHLWLIIFEELPFSSRVQPHRPRASEPDLVQQLEAELRTTKKEQQELVGELEAGNEELKAANEEILSMNEELQSTNEELVTSKEELQSMNEELTTLNAQLHDKVQELTAVNDDLANLLVSTDIVTLFLDNDLCIRRFTTAATRLLNLLPTDIDRPITHITTNLVDVDLARDGRTVLSTVGRIEREVLDKNERHYLLRMLPYRAADKTVRGVVVTLVDVTALKTIERELRVVSEQVSADLRRMSRLHEVSTTVAGDGDLGTQLDDILRAAVEITGADMGSIQVVKESGSLTIAAQHGFPQAFLDFFGRITMESDSACATAMSTRRCAIVEDVSSSPIFAGTQSLKVLLSAGVRAVQSTPLTDRAGQVVGMLSTHFRAPHQFTDSERRWLDLLARQSADLIVRRQTEALLQRAQTELEQRVAERTKWLALMHDVTRAINDAPSWDEGLHRVLRRICQSEHWQIGYVYLSDRDDPNVIVPVISCFGDERFRPFHTVSDRQRFTRGQSLPGRVYADGVALFVDDPDELLKLLPVRAELARQVGLKAAAALPVQFGNDLIAVLELFSDQPHPPNDLLETLMNDVSAQIGKVLERERSTAQMADLVWREQQGLLHTLHDSLGQTLTGLGMLSSGLRQQLADTHKTAAATAQQVAEQAQVALDQVRQLSQGLFPVEIDPEGLPSALRSLATTTEAFHKIRVHVHLDVPRSFRDSRVATQLYRIAQEAVTNAVKHANAGRINIDIGVARGTTTLRISDDGVGFQKALSKSDGLGLRIMRYRASSIGGQLSINPGADGGTLVTCTLRDVR